MGKSDIIVRITSEAGRNRIEIDQKATIKELKTIISGKLGLDPDMVKF